MKALSQMMWLMVAAVVVIVVGLVMLAIFTNVLGNNPFIDIKNRCIINGKSSCRAANALPVDWAAEVGPAGAKTSCQELLKHTTCPSEWLE